MFYVYPWQLCLRYSCAKLHVRTKYDPYYLIFVAGPCTKIKCNKIFAHEIFLALNICNLQYMCILPEVAISLTLYACISLKTHMLVQKSVQLWTAKESENPPIWLICSNNVTLSLGNSSFGWSSRLFRQPEGSLGIAGAQDKILWIYYQSKQLVHLTWCSIDFTYYRQCWSLLEFLLISLSLYVVLTTNWAGMSLHVYCMYM